MKVYRHTLDSDAVRDWLVDAYLLPNACWFVPYFDARRRALLIAANRRYSMIDEPDLAPPKELEALWARMEKRDGSLHVLPQMSDEARVEAVLSFIVAQPEVATRDALLRHFAARKDIVFGWRPGSMECLLDGREDPALLEAYRARLREAARWSVELTVGQFRLDEKPVVAISFFG